MQLVLARYRRLSAVYNGVSASQLLTEVGSLTASLARWDEAQIAALRVEARSAGRGSLGLALSPLGHLTQQFTPTKLRVLRLSCAPSRLGGGGRLGG